MNIDGFFLPQTNPGASSHQSARVREISLFHFLLAVRKLRANVGLNYRSSSISSVFIFLSSVWFHLASFYIACVNVL